MTQFDKLKKELTELSRLQVRIGYQQGDLPARQAGKSGKNATLLDIAVWNELGTQTKDGKQHIPPRPFLRQSVDNNQQQISDFIKKELAGLGNGKTAQQILQRLGTYQKGLIQQEIQKGDFTPNAPSTIKKKKSAAPLIDTGRLMQGVNFVIEEKPNDS
ncbi:MAG: hypothetical protein FWG65_09750 [Turicibacter sp.]|nr:hypothetical protein [Turicibacter sp.]